VPVCALRCAPLCRPDGDRPSSSSLRDRRREVGGAHRVAAPHLDLPRARRTAHTRQTPQCREPSRPFGERLAPITPHPPHTIAIVVPITFVPQPQAQGKGRATSSTMGRDAVVERGRSDDASATIKGMARREWVRSLHALGGPLSSRREEDLGPSAAVPPLPPHTPYVASRRARSARESARSLSRC